MSLNAANLTLGYQGRPIVEGLSVQIPAGKITALIGPNGSGKSTLLKALAGLLPPRQGEVRLADKPLSTYGRRALALQLAFMPQKPQVPDSIRVQDLVGYGRFPYQGLLRGLSAEDREVILWAMQQTGVADYAEHPVEALSGGQQQRVWIAMAIAQQTGILLLDEPTTFLDWGHQLEVLELLQRQNRAHGLTLVMSLHDLNQAAQFADHILVMQAGTLVAAGPPAEVIDRALLRSVFNVDAECYTGIDGRLHCRARGSAQGLALSRAVLKRDRMERESGIEYAHTVKTLR